VHALSAVARTYTSQLLVKYHYNKSCLNSNVVLKLLVGHLVRPIPNMVRHCANLVGKCPMSDRYFKHCKDRSSTKPAIVLDSSVYDVELSNSGELQRCIPSSSNNLKTNEDNTDDNSSRIVNLFTTT